MSEWIKVTDRLPPKDIKVLCYYYDQYMDIMEYWYDDENGKPEFWNPPSPPVNNVTHWMPLPLSPQLQEEEMRKFNMGFAYKPRKNDE